MCDLGLLCRKEARDRLDRDIVTEILTEKDWLLSGEIDKLCVINRSCSSDRSVFVNVILGIADLGYDSATPAI